MRTFSTMTPGSPPAFSLCAQGSSPCSQDMVLAGILHPILGSLDTARHLPF